MTISLPGSIATYFEASNSRDCVRLARCFAQDAVVRDEDRRHQGLEAIQSWFQEAWQKYAYSVEPLSVSIEGARIAVAGKVDGNFPGSPVLLAHVFQLVGDKIQSLEIH